MTYIVTENCINCKFQDCVAVCPVDCFYEGPNFLCIHPEECIDCGVCEPACPAEAIKPDTAPGLDGWLEINARYSSAWPNIIEIGTVPPDAEEWNGKPDKMRLLLTGETMPEPKAKKPVYETGAARHEDPNFEVEGAVLAFPPARDGEQLVTLAPRETVPAEAFEIDGLYVGQKAND